MDNFQKALQMAVAVFLFVIAASTAIFLYLSLIENVQEIFKSVDTTRRSAETTLVDPNTTDYKRKISQSEIILTILDMKNPNSWTKSVDINHYSGIVSFYNDDTDEEIRSDIKKFLNWYSDTDKYKCSYSIDSDGKTKITYTQIEEVI